MSNILEILVCPITKGRLEYDKDRQLLISHQAGLAFPIVNGVANMLVDDSIDLHKLPETPKNALKGKPALDPAQQDNQSSVTKQSMKKQDESVDEA